jgi:adenine/guanine phosphoribosyltransferase-like PRPP-binding protein
VKDVTQMSTPFYAYDNRQGVLPISWEDFFSLCKGLALAVAPYQPEVILGIARGGLYPAILLSHLLQAEFYPIRQQHLGAQAVYLLLELFNNSLIDQRVVHRASWSCANRAVPTRIPIGIHRAHSYA